jgi:hypothetical protein
MSNYIVNKIINKFKIHNFNTFFIFGEDNNISLLKKFNRFVHEGYVSDDSLKKKYEDIFCKIRKCIYGFHRLIIMWKIKHAKISSTDYDFILNPLSSFPENQKIKIYHKGALYNFRLTDILNIWLTSLCKNSSLIPMPEIPKNPYINIEFSKGQLLKFYIHIRYRTKFMIPTLIQDFINCEMNLELFKYHSYAPLVDICIKNHFENESDEILYFDCVRMVAKYKNKLKNRTMSTDITMSEKKDAVNKLRPMLKKYLYSTYSCNPKVRCINKINLVSDLRKVFKENVRLGRKIFIPIRRRIRDISNNENDSNNSDSLPSLSDAETDTDTDETTSGSELHSRESFSEEEIFDNEPVFFYSTFINSDELGLDDDDENDPMNQVD